MMKQNFCDRTILFTRKFVMSSVKMETVTQSFPLSDGGNWEAKKDSLIHEARHLIAFFCLFVFFKSFSSLFIGMWHLFLFALLAAFTCGNELNVNRQ